MEQEKRTKGKLLTVKKASETYGLDPSLIYYWIRYRQFDFFKPDKRIVFWETDFLDFLEQHKVKKHQELENESPHTSDQARVRARDTGANDEKNFTTS